jgi:hypothetical protein
VGRPPARWLQARRVPASRAGNQQVDDRRLLNPAREAEGARVRNVNSASQPVAPQGPRSSHRFSYSYVAVPSPIPDMRKSRTIASISRADARSLPALVPREIRGRSFGRPVQLGAENIDAVASVSRRHLATRCGSDVLCTAEGCGCGLEFYCADCLLVNLPGFRGLARGAGAERIVVANVST